MLFKTVCDVYSLIPEENYTIPPEAEGLAAKDGDKKNGDKKEGKAVLKEQGNDDTATTDDADATTTTSTGATTRRHKATPSFSSSVAAIAEGDEDDSKADSPTKDKGGVPVHGISGISKEAPLAQISKTAERKEDPPAFLEENISGHPVPDSSKQLPEKEGSGGNLAEEAQAGANQPRANPTAEGDHAKVESVADDHDTQQEVSVEGV